MSLNFTLVISVAVLVCVCSVAPAPPFPLSPEWVEAVLGSCVLLPCSFLPWLGTRGADGGGHGVGMAVRLRFASSFPGLRKTAFNSDPTESLKSKGHLIGRVALAGDLDLGDCSLTIANVSANDAKTYEIQLKEKRGTWGRAASVRLSISRSPEQPLLSAPRVVMSGQVAVLNCSVKVTCPSQAPTLQWVLERGVGQREKTMERVEMVQADNGQLILHSSLSFTPSHMVKPRLRCEAVYPGGPSSSASRELHVNFPPTDVFVEVHTERAREGGSATLVCTCKADPPTSRYHWTYIRSGITFPLPSHTHSARIHNITRDTLVRCSASNDLGTAESPPTSLNVHYAPAILPQSSFCQWLGTVVTCCCTIDSNPHSTVTWSVDGRTPSAGYNISSSYNQYTLVEMLTGPALAQPDVTCYAVNALGNDSHMLLLQEGGGNMLQTLMLAGLGLLLFVILLVVLLLLCCCRSRVGRRRRGVLNCGGPVFPDSVGIYQEHVPLYINCTEVTNIYTNGSYQLVYQNCTPCFIRTKQIYKRQRRGGRRLRSGLETDGRVQEDPRQMDKQTDPDTAIYVEVI